MALGSVFALCVIARTKLGSWSLVYEAGAAEALELRDSRKVAWDCLRRTVTRRGRALTGRKAKATRRENSMRIFDDHCEQFQLRPCGNEPEIADWTSFPRCNFQNARGRYDCNCSITLVWDVIWTGGAHDEAVGHAHGELVWGHVVRAIVGMKIAVLYFQKV